MSTINNKSRALVIGAAMGMAFAVPVALGGDLTIPKTWVPDEALNAADLNDNFQAVETEVDDNNSRITTVETAVDDNDLRITTLEGKSPDIGRIVVPVISVSGGGTISGSTGVLPDAATSSAFGGSFGSPSDYVSGDITISALVSGCGGSTIVHENLGLDRVNIGSNSSFFVISCTATSTCPTLSIPSSPLFTYEVVEAVAPSITSLGDINTPRFTRLGNEASDICTGSIVVEGFIIEYPRGN